LPKKDTAAIGAKAPVFKRPDYSFLSLRGTKQPHDKKQ